MKFPIPPTLSVSLHLFSACMRAHTCVWESQWVCELWWSSCDWPSHKNQPKRSWGWGTRVGKEAEAKQFKIELCELVLRVNLWQLPRLWLSRAEMSLVVFAFVSFFLFGFWDGVVFWSLGWGRTSYGSQASLDLSVIFLPQAHKYQNYRFAPPHSAMRLFFPQWWPELNHVLNQQHKILSVSFKKIFSFCQIKAGWKYHQDIIFFFHQPTWHEDYLI